MLFTFLSIAGAAACLVFGLAFAWMKVPIIIGLCYGLAALGVMVLMRAGQVSFGHALYACVAGYAVAFLARRFPGADAVLLIIAGVIVALIAAAPIGVFVVRYREIFFGMLNLALSMVLYSVLGKFYEITGGTDGLRIDRTPLLGMTFDRAGYETALLIIAVLASVAFGSLIQHFFRSSTGEALAGIKTNETRLEYLGLSSRWILWIGYMLSAGLVGLSGALFVLLQGLVTPELGYWVRSAEFVFIAILGGAAHALGPFLGALIFQLIQLLGAIFFAGVWKLLLGATLILVILVAPAGITGMLPLIRRKGGPKDVPLQAVPERT